MDNLAKALASSSAKSELDRMLKPLETIMRQANGVEVDICTLQGIIIDVCDSSREALELLKNAAFQADASDALAGLAKEAADARTRPAKRGIPKQHWNNLARWA
jgi:hypothetical protein